MKTISKQTQKTIAHKNATILNRSLKYHKNHKSFFIFFFMMFFPFFFQCSNGFERFLPKPPIKPAPKVISSTPQNETQNLNINTKQWEFSFDQDIKLNNTVKPLAWDISTKDDGNTVENEISLENSQAVLSGRKVTISHNWGALPENSTIKIQIPEGYVSNFDSQKNEQYTFTIHTGVLLGSVPVVPSFAKSKICVEFDVPNNKWIKEPNCTGTFSENSTGNPSGQDGLIHETAFLASTANDGDTVITVNTRRGVVFTNQGPYNNIRIQNDNYTVSSITTNQLTISPAISNGPHGANTLVYRAISTTPQSQRIRGVRQNGGFSNDQITFEKTTKLHWTTCSLGQTYSSTGVPCPGTPTDFTWTQAIAGCGALNLENNGAGYGGLTDWRLPTSAELFSILDFSRYNESGFATIDVYLDNPASGTTTEGVGVERGSPFPQKVTPSHYWTNSGYKIQINVSGTQRIINPNARTVDFSKGIIDSKPKGEFHKARCVSAGNADYANQSFTALADVTDSVAKFESTPGTPYNFSVMRDEATGLEWQKCVYGQRSNDCTGGIAEKMNWIKAVHYCESLNSGDHKFTPENQWHLPTIGELATLITRNNLHNSYDINTFPNVPESGTGAHWSSTPYTPFTNTSLSNWDSARLLSLKYGQMTFANRCNNSANTNPSCDRDKAKNGYVRCVRARSNY